MTTSRAISYSLKSWVSLKLFVRVTIFQVIQEINDQGYKNFDEWIIALTFIVQNWSIYIQGNNLLIEPN